MTPESAIEHERSRLIRLVGPIRRARAYRLYTLDGRRIVDLWQDGGRAILGHSGGGVAAMKNALDRGPNVPLPSIFERRLSSALDRLVPGELTHRVFGNYDRAVAAAARWTGRQVTAADLWDPVSSVSDPLAVGGAVRLWRPFLPSSGPPDPGANRFALLPVLPVLGDSPPQVVLFAGQPTPAAPPDTTPADSREIDPRPADSDLIAPFRLAALIRGIHDLLSAPSRPGVELAGFSAIGPYLLPLPSQRSYTRRFEIFLERGYLMSPDPAVPSIIPAEISSGELMQLRRAASIAVQSESGDGN